MFFRSGNTMVMFNFSAFEYGSFLRNQIFVIFTGMVPIDGIFPDRGTQCRRSGCIPPIKEKTNSWSSSLRCWREQGWEVMTTSLLGRRLYSISALPHQQCKAFQLNVPIQ